MPGTVSLRPAAPTEELVLQYRAVRQFSEHLCTTLETEDYVVQSMPDASPIKWHLAHTSWFFETFVLEPSIPNYRSYDPAFRVVFNSYYNSVGPKHSRPLRGTLSRPTVAQTYAYRRSVDQCMEDLLATEMSPDLQSVVVLGLNHEQQHQELMVTDMKHAFSMNPLNPVYRECPVQLEAPVPTHSWIRYDEAVRCVGHDGVRFAFDNEGPRHQELVHGFSMGSRLITIGEYIAFIEDGGYTTPTLWLSDGWSAVQAHDWQAPLYWRRRADGQGWENFTLSGIRPVAADEPVTHISYYEADAFAHWSGARLAGEAEWETAAAGRPISGNFVESQNFHPAPLAASSVESPRQLFGDVWEWTRSAYLPYPGYQAAPGALGEYNGKFMCNQFVLRGGSCATAQSHIRSTYRNFFPPDARWQFSGIRLAKDA